MTKANPETPTARTISEKLNAADAVLGRGFDGRVSWFKRAWTGRRARGRLQKALPVVVAQYEAEAHKFYALSRDLRRTRRRLVSWLWVQITLAGFVAVLRRFGWLILIVLVAAAVIYFVATYWSSFVEFVFSFAPTPEPADPANGAPANEAVGNGGTEPEGGSPGTTEEISNTDDGAPVREVQDAYPAPQAGDP